MVKSGNKDGWVDRPSNLSTEDLRAYLEEIFTTMPKNTRDFLPIKHLGPGALILFDKAIKKLLDEEKQEE